MTKRIVSTAALILLAAGPAIAAQPANPYHQRLLRMDAVQRDAVFRRTIRESGLRCGRVTGSRFQERYRNLMMWTAQCEPARTVAIFIGPDSSVQARNCAEHAQLKLPICAKPR